MRHQRAEQAAACPLPEAVGIDEQCLHTEAFGMNSRPQAHNAAADDQQIDG